MTKIVDVVIFYDNETEVYTYAKGLCKQTASKYVDLVIVVNKLGDTKVEIFKEKLLKLPLNIFIFNPNKNLGYLNGVIYGYNQYYKLTNNIPDWFIVSNTDIEFSDNNFFEKFINTSYDDDVWCVAPSVYSIKKKSYDNPEYINRCSKELIDKLIFIHERPFLAYLYANAAKVKGMLRRKEKQKSQYIYSAKGCFFILKNEMAQLLKDKVYGALMYSEESYIAEIIRDNKKRIYYDCEIEVIHNESSVTGKLEMKRRSKYIADSLKIIRDEFYTN